MSSDSVMIALPVDFADATMLEVCSISLRVNKKVFFKRNTYKHMLNSYKRNLMQPWVVGIIKANKHIADTNNTKKCA